MEAEAVARKKLAQDNVMASHCYQDDVRGISVIRSTTAVGCCNIKDQKKSRILTGVVTLSFATFVMIIKFCCEFLYTPKNNVNVQKDII